MRGTAASTLRPAGIAHLDGERVDVVSDGELIEAGEPIEVIRVDGNRIVVRRPAGATRQE
jgi:membrane-bound serine protease (ClpP class)